MPEVWHSVLDVIFRHNPSHSQMEKDLEKTMSQTPPTRFHKTAFFDKFLIGDGHLENNFRIDESYILEEGSISSEIMFSLGFSLCKLASSL